MKKAFLTGLVILMPLALTIMALVFLVDLLTDPFLNIVREYLLERQDWIQSPNLITLVARICILLFLFFFLIFLGFIARIFFIRWGLNIVQKVLVKIPVIKPIYKTTKDIVSAFFQQESRKAFKHPIMVNFPSKKSLAVGFVSGEIPKICAKHIEKTFTPVFIPTAPHPISGFMLMVPEENAYPISMSNEEAVKFTVSCGVILPKESDK